MSFTTLGLSDALVQGILATGYTAPTEIQSRAIPFAVQGNDVIGLAQTGTGKTAAFVLPLLNKLSLTEPLKHRTVRALILTPTRELASQIENAIKEYGRFMKLFSLTIYGGTDMRRQIRELQRGYDILIATPGRLLDHLNQRTMDLSHVEMLVLDEADRMLDMGFVNDVKKIISAIPKDRQTLLFSATMSQGIKTLTATVQRSPKVVQVGQERKPADSVTQKFYTVDQEQKTALLFHILDTVEMDSVLVFSRTKHGADKIQHRLEKRGIEAVAIHSNRTQAQRERALLGFRKKHFKVLVATDIAARGIDIDGISHVINYDTPNFAEDYVHRIGRTGRASATGDAITFVARDEYKHFKRISEFVGKRFDIGRYPNFTNVDTSEILKEEGISKFKPEPDPRSDRRPRTTRSSSGGGGRPSDPRRRDSQRFETKSFNSRGADGERTHSTEKPRFDGNSAASPYKKKSYEKRPFGNKPGDKLGDKSGDKSSFGKPKTERSFRERPTGDRPYRERPFGEKNGGGFQQKRRSSPKRDSSSPAQFAPRNEQGDWKKLLSDDEAYERVQRKKD